MGLERLQAATANGSDVADVLRRDGAVVVEGLIDPDAVAEVLGGVRPHLDAREHGRDRFEGTSTKRLGSLVARVPAVRPLITSPLVLAAVADVFADATTVQLNATQVVALSSGEARQPLHRDQWAWDHFPWPVGYEVEVSTMWALTDFTVDNGATHLFPGSSRLDDHSGLALAEARAEMRRGSVLLYDGKVLHGGGANRTTEARQGVNITYAVGWVRQEENQYLACPPEIARDLDDDLLRLMGYRQGAFALGYVGDQTDPLAALRGRADKVATVGEYAEGSANYRGFVAELDGD